MEGWVDLGDLLHRLPRWFTCSQTVTYPSTNRAQCRLTIYVDRSQRANHYTMPPPWYDHSASVSFTSNSTMKTLEWCNETEYTRVTISQYPHLYLCHRCSQILFPPALSLTVWTRGIVLGMSGGKCPRAYTLVKAKIHYTSFPVASLQQVGAGRSPFVSVVSCRFRNSIRLERLVADWLAVSLTSPQQVDSFPVYG